MDDLDISDILASVSRPQHAGGSFDPHSSSSPSATPFDPATLPDHMLLTRHWTTERSTPSLSPYPTALLARTTARIAGQIARIEALAAGDDSGSGSGTANNLVLSVLQSDLARAQFLVRSYLRCRLGKLTRHALHYLAQPEQQDGVALLGDSEREFLRAHHALVGGLYGAAFLDALPPGLRRLDDHAAGLDMVERPDFDGAVVARCLAERWGNEADLVAGEDDGGGKGDEATVELQMRRGEVWVVRWRDVRGGVERGEVEVL